MFACDVSGLCCQPGALWGSSEMLSCLRNSSKLNQKCADVQNLCQPTKKPKKTKVICLLLSGVTLTANLTRISQIHKAFLPCTEARGICAQYPFIHVQNWFYPCSH